MFFSSIKPVFDGNLLGVVSANAAHFVWVKTSAWLGGSWARSNFCFPHLLFASQHISKYLKSWFSVLSNSAAVSTFLSEGHYQTSTSVLFWLYCMRCWKKCAYDKLKFLLLNIEIVMGRRREAINICFIIWKVSRFAALYNRKRKLSPLCLYLLQALTKYPFNLLLKFIVEMFEC